MDGKIILPDSVTGRDPAGAIRVALERHNLAMRSMTPPQLEAVNRLVLATILANTMAGDAPPEVQRGAAMEALQEVLRREARGEKNQPVMWTKNTEVETTDQLVERLARQTRESD